MNQDDRMSQNGTRFDKSERMTALRNTFGRARPQLGAPTKVVLPSSAAPFLCLTAFLSSLYLPEFKLPGEEMLR
jgi:hypothetical protein